MVRLFLFFNLFLISGLTIYGQKNVNDYKYVIVPKRYDFLKKQDAYQLNSLTKFLFNKYGFEAYMQGEDFPEDLKADGCKALHADLKKNSSLFVTKVSVELSDCNGDVVFASSEGTSKEKDYKKAYHESLRKAFKDIQTLNYKYNQKSGTIINSTEPSTKEYPVIVQQKEEVQKSKKNKNASVTATPILGNSVSYELNGSNFIFKRREYGFELLQKSEQEVLLGKIYKSSKDNVYIVKASDYSGVGYFDGFGNFILDRINPVTNKVITDTFARQ